MADSTALANQNRTAIWQHSEKLSDPHRQWISMQLTVIASARQATVSPMDLRLYSKAMADYHRIDIEAAVQELCLTERRDGETAFPALATVLKALRAVVSARRRRETAKRRENCQTCKGVGWVVEMKDKDSAARRCDCAKGIE